MDEEVDPEREPQQVRPTPDQQAHATRLVAELAKIRFVLPGSLTRRYTRCGRTGCRCMADPPQPHGPYWWWTRKVNAKTVTRILTDDQHADFGPWFEAARRLRAITAELEALGLAIIEADPRSTRQARSATAAKPGRPVDNPRSQHR